MSNNAMPYIGQIPEKWEEARLELITRLAQMIDVLNTRESGVFSESSALLNRVFSIDGKSAISFRKVINFGQLPNSTTKTVPHGINFTDSFILKDLYGSATDTTGKTAFAIQYWQLLSAGAVDITLRMTENDVEIITNSDYSAFNKCLVIIEYAREQ